MEMYMTRLKEDSLLIDSLLLIAIFVLYGLVVPIMILLLPFHLIAEFVNEKIKMVQHEPQTSKLTHVETKQI